MNQRSCAVYTLLGVMVIGSGCTETQSQPDSTQRRSVLMLTLDTTRRDHMGFLGHEPSVTPHLDRLASQSVVFEDALTVAPLTLPAHTSLMTGLYPSSHGVRDNALFRVPDQARTLAESLQEEGWDTRAAVAAFVLDPVFGLDQGFEEYDAPARFSGSSSQWFAERSAEHMVDRALEMMDDVEGPFFFWLHLFDPHAPYTPASHRPDPPDNGNAVQYGRMLYEAEIQAMDEQVGRLLQSLAERGMDEDLVVVVASDHGEGLGEHGESTHGFFLYDTTVRVPLLIRHPDLAPQRVSTPVSLVDVMPTLLTLLGVAQQGPAMDGIDLAPGLRGEAPMDPGRWRVLESRHLLYNHSWAPYEALVTGPWKYVHSRQDALYERDKDPDESRNLIDHQPELARRFAQRVEQVFGRAPSLASATQTLSHAEQEAMQELGYIEATRSLDTSRPDFDALPAAEDRMDLLMRWEDSTNAMNSGRPLVAVNILRELVRRWPGSADFRQRLGAMLLTLGPDYLAQAAEALEEAVRIQYQRPEAHFNRGLCYSQMSGRSRAKGKDQEARTTGATAAAAYRDCLVFEPDHPEALMNCVDLMVREVRLLQRESRHLEAGILRQDALDLLLHYLEASPEDHPRRWHALQLLGEQGALSDRPD